MTPPSPFRFCWSFLGRHKITRQVVKNLRGFFMTNLDTSRFLGGPAKLCEKICLALEKIIYPWHLFYESGQSVPLSIKIIETKDKVTRMTMIPAKVVWASEATINDHKGPLERLHAMVNFAFMETSFIWLSGDLPVSASASWGHWNEGQGHVNDLCNRWDHLKGLKVFHVYCSSVYWACYCHHVSPHRGRHWRRGRMNLSGSTPLFWWLMILDLRQNKICSRIPGSGATINLWR